MVQNAEWGPSLWRILHALAERLGRQSVSLVAQDEARTWLQILRLTEGLMPCALCRSHYRAWRHTHPIEGFGTGDLLRESSRRWLWELHENVNHRKAMEAGGWLDASGAQAPFPFESLEGVYGAAAVRGGTLSQDIATLSAVLQRATQAGLVDGDRIRTWKAAVSLLRRLTGA